jgi:hypothetical protein
VGQKSAHCRLLYGGRTFTLRAGWLWSLVPGKIAPVWPAKPRIYAGIPISRAQSSRLGLMLRNGVGHAAPPVGLDRQPAVPALYECARSRQTSAAHNPLRPRPFLGTSGVDPEREQSALELMRRCTCLIRPIGAARSNTKVTVVRHQDLDLVHPDPVLRP